MRFIFYINTHNLKTFHTDVLQQTFTKVNNDRKSTAQYRSDLKIENVRHGFP